MTQDSCVREGQTDTILLALKGLRSHPHPWAACYIYPPAAAAAATGECPPPLGDYQHPPTTGKQDPEPWPQRTRNRREALHCLVFQSTQDRGFRYRGTPEARRRGPAASWRRATGFLCRDAQDPFENLPQSSHVPRPRRVLQLERGDDGYSRYGDMRTGERGGGGGFLCEINKL